MSDTKGAESPFCIRPTCPCALPDATPCDEFKDATDSAGVHRCAECGNRESTHAQ